MTTPFGFVPSTPASAPVDTTPKPKTGESAMGPDAFMKLLVAQLKYQNPMAPADGQAYMTQMATFTQVEKLDQLVKAQADAVLWQQRVSAEGLVGRSVTGTTDGEKISGTVVGVKYADKTTVLELSNGKTVAAGDVDHVASGTLAPPAAPAGTPASSGTSTSTGTSTSSGTGAGSGTSPGTGTGSGTSSGTGAGSGTSAGTGTSSGTPST